jgi:pyruvate/2-oxoglutarate dehydrogenase complex dihydrolipoamide acyltransferase (E2) component
MRTPVLLPDLGAQPVTCSLWLVGIDEPVREGERLVEVLVEGAAFNVSAPTTGRLVERRAEPREVLTPGQVLGVILEDRGS